MRWPKTREVLTALEARARELLAERPEVQRVGVFGSHARGDAGVGSDLDVVLVVAEAEERFELRGLRYDLTALPVPVDLVVYTEEEWTDGAPRFGDEVEWVAERG